MSLVLKPAGGASVTMVADLVMSGTGNGNTDVPKSR